ncbi:MAG: IS110 family RNA-guided transposase [Ignavibacteriaceae bacterium]
MKSINENSFTDCHFYIGIDTHLRNWRITIRFNSIELKTLSMNPSPVELLNYLRKKYPGGTYHIVYEAGFCGFWAERKFKELGVDCIVVNPADVPTSNKEKVNKNDPIDSRKLSRELENKSLTGIYIPDIFHEELRSLMRLRYRIVQNQTRIKNRIKSLLHTRGFKIPDRFAGNSRWSAAFIKWLNEEIKFNTTAGSYCFLDMILQLKDLRGHNKNVLKQLRQEATKTEIAPIIKALQSVAGIGFITAMSLYTEIIDIRRFSYEDQFNAFVGLVPSTRSSDENIYCNKISFRQNKYLRPLMIEAAWRAVREDPAMTAKYKELTQRMKPQDAIIRIAKKLLRRIRHVWLKQEEYVYALVA